MSDDEIWDGLWRAMTILMEIWIAMQVPETDQPKGKGKGKTKSKDKGDQHKGGQHKGFGKGTASSSSGSRSEPYPSPGTPARLFSSMPNLPGSSSGNTPLTPTAGVVQPPGVPPTTAPNLPPLDD